MLACSLFLYVLIIGGTCFLLTVCCSVSLNCLFSLSLQSWGDFYYFCFQRTNILNLGKIIRILIKNVFLSVNQKLIFKNPIIIKKPWMDLENIMLQFSSATQSCPTLCDPMNRSTPGLPVHHQLPEFTQTHAHRVGDAIQPSHPLSSLLLLPPIPPSIRVFSNESTWGGRQILSDITYMWNLKKNTSK